ncbi:MAG: hypothetical protein ACFFA8_11535 [Promethearchaeota archaeon]
MEENNLFPNYKPKKTPDTIHDYLKAPKSKIFEIISDIGEPSLNNLHDIINLFNKYVKKAKENPGGVRKGNIAIGADLDQYYPSEEELVVSELGKMIRRIIESNRKKDVDKLMKKNGIKSQKVEFSEIYFRHVDVMGSGRYFYAEKKEPKIEIKL